MYILAASIILKWGERKMSFNLTSKDDQDGASNLIDKYVCSVHDTPFAVIERVINSGVGRCLVVNEKNELLGEITLEVLRGAVKSGHWLSASDLSSLISPCVPGLALTPVLDSKSRVIDVVVDQSAEFVPVAQPQLTHTEFRNLVDAFLSTWVSSTGEYIHKFEKRFAAKISMSHAAATSNGTVSLHLALLALGIGPGDEVIVPDFTFVASINAILYCNATPVIVDIDPLTWCMTVETFERAITPWTKAVMPVHVFGQMAPMTEIAAIAAKRGIYVMEDCAEALGAKYDGRYAGSFGAISSFSFFANKIITTGQGGMCLTNDPDLARKIRVLRDHGMHPERRYWHEQVGYNYSMTNIQASLGLAQLGRMDEIIQRNRDLAAMYKDALRDIPGVQFSLQSSPRVEPIVWFVCAQVPAEKRAKLITTAKEKNVDIRPFFNSLSAMPAYANWARPVPRSRRVSLSGVNLPTSHRVDERVVRKIAAIFREVLT
jgi:perosamine synthetase